MSEPPAPSTATHEPAEGARSGGFGQLARRISGWTSRALVSLMILVAGIGFGRQVLIWWAEDATPAAPPAVASVGFADLDALSVLEFGDQPWALRRRAVFGDQATMIRELRSLCREAATAAPPPEPVSANERRLLERLAEEKPTETLAGGIRLYDVAGPLPTAVAIGPVEAKVRIAGEDTSTEAVHAAQPNVARSADRVISWGLAIPAGENRWTAWALERNNSTSKAGASHPVEPEFELPRGARRTLVVRGGGETAGRSAMIGFVGRGDPGKWRRSFDEWAARSSYRTTYGWRRSGAGWYVHYETGLEGQGGSVDIRFGPGRGEELSGMMLVVTPAGSD